MRRDEATSFFFFIGFAPSTSPETPPPSVGESTTSFIVRRMRMSRKFLSSEKPPPPPPPVVVFVPEEEWLLPAPIPMPCVKRRFCWRRATTAPGSLMLRGEPIGEFPPPPPPPPLCDDEAGRLRITTPEASVTVGAAGGIRCGLGGDAP